MRDRLVVVGAVVAVAGLIGLVVVTVLDAQRNGRDALEELQRAQVQQLAASMDTRLTETFGSLGAISARQWSLQPDDPGDAELLDGIVNPESKTGTFLVDLDGTVLQGLLLGDLGIGDAVDYDGLDDLLAEPTVAILPVADGRTAALPVFPFIVPVVSPTGALGLLVFEVEVSPESAFNLEVAELGRGETGQFFFVDSNGTVLASSDRSLLARPVPDERLLTREAGLVRIDGRVEAIAEVPGVGWRAVFRQDIDEFEGGLTSSIQNALLLLAAGAVAAVGITAVLLYRRLRASREEQRRLVELNESREEVVSIVSHELRTPVSGIAGFLQTTIDHWESMSDEERRDAVRRASANARRLQALTRDVLDTAAVESGELTYAFDEVDLAEEVTTALDAARDLHPNRTFTGGDIREPLVVRADPDRVQQVLGNLIENAVKNSPPESPVEVTASADGDDAVVSVIDKGAGMPDDILEKVFDKFVRSRGVGVEGSGLGLYICRQIVQAHGGRIWASSLEGMGATFTFTLPRTSVPATQG